MSTPSTHKPRTKSPLASPTASPVIGPKSVGKAAFEAQQILDSMVATKREAERASKLHEAKQSKTFYRDSIEEMLEQKLISEKNKKARTAGSSGGTNGLASSLAFTPVQGIELVNPSQKQDSKEGTETYFSKQAAILGAGT